jgi:hypothetical protein
MANASKRFTLSALLLWISLAVIAAEPFNQRADYLIQATLYPGEKAVSARVEITYTNNSPQALDSIFIHLWPNAYSNYETPLAKQLLENGRLDFHFAKRKDLGYIDSLNFTVQGEQAYYYLLPGQPDVAVVKLPEPIPTNGKVVIATPFKIKLPKLVSRAGYAGNTFVISQWFPKVAVFNSNGWHPMSYLEQGEFFSDFGSYDVQITVPNNYVVAATGLHDASISKEDSINKTTTWKIEQEHIHDFCWVASPDLKLIKDKVALPGGKEVEIRIYSRNPSEWKQHIAAVKTTLLAMSEWVGDYPYPVCTVVEGPLKAGGGMEYPTLTIVDGSSGMGNSLQRVIVHEVIHNWWYGILASNERAVPWIDEGFCSYYEDRVMMLINGETPEERKPLISAGVFMDRLFGLNQITQATLLKMFVTHFSRLGRQIPMDLPAESYSMLQYGGIVYYKTAIALAGLEMYLGTMTFDEAVQGLYANHAFTHIDKDIIRTTFEQVSGQNLSWFFEGTLSSHRDADYAIQGIKKLEDGKLLVKIRNKSGIAAPVSIGYPGSRKEGYPTTQVAPIPVFSTGEKTFLLPYTSEKMIGIDPSNTSLDLNTSNNFFRTKGLLKKMPPLKLQWLAAPEDPRRTQLFFTPVIGGNKADKFMLGMALYNRVFPAKDLEWSFVPMYAFGSKQFTWLANIDYYGHPSKGKIREWSVGAHGKSFTMSPKPVAQQFFKAEPHAYILFKGKSERSRLEQKLSFRHIQIIEEGLVYSSAIDYRDTTFRHWLNEIKYTLEQKRALNPYNASASIEHNSDWMKFSAEGRIRVNLGPMKKYFAIRGFVGAFMYVNDDFRVRLNKRFGHTLSGATGKNDYQYDQTYFGRYFNEKLAGAQIALTGGQFKVITPRLITETGQTFNWLMAINLTLDAPVKWLPLQFFADLGYSYDNRLSTTLPANDLQYDLGLALSLMDGAIAIYLPFAMSKDFKVYYKTELPKFYQRFTFSIDFARINPHKVIRTLLF